MKKIISLALLGLVASASHAEKPNESNIGLYMLSNKKVLEDTVGELELANLIRGKIPKSKKIALRNIELNGTSDKKITALVEDQLINQLVNAGYSVVERDDNALKHSIEEKAAGNNYAITASTIQTKKQNKDFIEADKVVVEFTPESEKTVSKDGLQISNINVNKDTSLKLLRTHLAGADFIINYRIQELGVNYTQTKQQDYDDESSRLAIARINFRAENAKTGVIVASNSLISAKSDIVSDFTKAQLASYEYSQFYNSYPTKNSFEDRLIDYSIEPDYRWFIEYDFISSQEEGSKLGFGFKRGDYRLSVEKASFDVEEKIGGDEVTLSNEFIMFNAGYSLSNFETPVGEGILLVELGLGNGDMNLKDDDEVEDSKGFAAKAGIGVEIDIVWDISFKGGIDLYAGEAGVVEHANMGLIYTF